MKQQTLCERVDHFIRLPRVMKIKATGGTTQSYRVTELFENSTLSQQALKLVEDIMLLHIVQCINMHIIS